MNTKSNNAANSALSIINIVNNGGPIVRELPSPRTERLFDFRVWCLLFPVWMSTVDILEEEMSESTRWLSQLNFEGLIASENCVVLSTRGRQIANDIREKYGHNLLIAWKNAEITQSLVNKINDIIICSRGDLEGLILSINPLNEVILYKDRKEKSENAPAFLKRVYADELAAGSLTLSDLRQRDKSLWAGLRNWASAGKHDLDAIIPRGRSRPGSGPQKLDFDPSKLDPNDDRDALALQALRQRERTRERVRDHRRRKLAPRM